MAEAADLIFLHDDELGDRLVEARRELFNLRFQLATGQLDNPARVRLVRRDVARVLTVLREREIEEAEGTYVPATEEQHVEALAHLAAEDAAREAAEKARAASRGEGEGEAEEGAEGEMAPGVEGVEGAAEAGGLDEDGEPVVELDEDDDLVASAQGADDEEEA